VKLVERLGKQSQCLEENIISLKEEQ